MQLNDAQIKALLEPFNEKFIERRKIDEQLVVFHDYVRARLSEIFGPLGWTEQTLELTEVPCGDNGQFRYVAYRARVRVTIRDPDNPPGAFWDGAGAWGQGREVKDRTSFWALHSDCMNGALSVAFLRATKNLGSAFGLSLYATDRNQPAYEIDRFLTHGFPDQYGAGDGDEPQQEEIDMGYTPDPEAEHAAP